MGKPDRRMIYARVDWQAALAVRKAARERGVTISKVVREVVEREFLGKAGAAEIAQEPVRQDLSGGGDYGGCDRE